MGMKRWRPWLSGIAAAFMLALAMPAQAAETNAGSASITILHTNDIHSRVDGSDDSIGYARLSALIKQVKEQNPNTLVIDAGDTFHGQTIANLVRGESIVRIMNEIGYDAMAPGNHDFNYGQERLLELAQETRFPILAANVKREDGSRLLESSVVREVGGVKIGLFGLSTPETAFKTHPNNVAGIDFADPVAEAKAAVAELQGKADVIVAIAHLGVDKSSVDTSIKVAEQVPGIDLIIDGHSHTLLEQGMQVGDTLIVQTGEYGKNLGRVELTVSGGEVTAKTASVITRAAAESVQPDQAVIRIIDEIKQEQDKVLSEVVGSTPVKLVGEREVVRKGESNLGNLIADAMLDETGADVALTNGGGIRASIEAGPVTKGQVVSVLPFGNYIQTKQVKGSDIVAALEHGVSAYPEPLGGFPHVAGMTFEFDPGLPAGQRVTDVKIQGAPLNPEQTYMLATNDFMAAGGDQYTMFKDYPVANDYSSLEESVIAYLQKNGEAKAAVEGRIVAKQQAAAQPQQEAPQNSPAAPATTPATTPATPPATTPAPAEPEAAARPKVYIVQKGDSLWKISIQYQTTWQKLQQLNGLSNPRLIYPGQQLVLPAE